MQYKFAAVCIPPPLAGAAREYLAGGGGMGVKVATVIGFPFGYSALAAKLAETEQAMGAADELDVVINLIALRNGDWDFLEREMRAIVALVHGDTGSGAGRDRKVLKVIIESGILSDEEIVRCCELYSRVGVDFLKTSTGYAEKGASVAAVQLMRQHLPPSIQIKASGGIRSYTFARELIGAGASRLGCSASVEIVRGEGNAPEEAGGSGY